MARSPNALYLPALGAYRAQTAIRRAEAFCNVPEYVAGTRVKPLTPATFSMLHATRSGFLTGRQVRVEDVINYLWIHSRGHVCTGVFGYGLRKKWALRRFRFEMGQPWMKWIGRKPDRARAIGVLNIAIAEIRQTLDDAFADSPAPSARPSKPIATLEAFFVHEFATAYNWPPEKTRHFPLRQLVQLHRCIRSARGDELSDEGEDKILADHMQAMQDAHDAKKVEAVHV